VQKESKTTPLVKMVGITKRFPGGVVANDHINFEVYPGEVHALLGENGAGKTTLMSVLYGLYKLDEGEIYIEGRRVKISSPRDAISLGIAMVHQHFQLIDRFTVAENVALALSPHLGYRLNLKYVIEKVLEIGEKYGLKVDPNALVESLSAGERQRVEIIKALVQEPKLLILDEPTSVLTAQEVEGLFRFIRKFVSEGKSVVFITHKLHEVMEISDRVTVLRKGRVVGVFRTKDVTIEELARAMVGKEKEPVPELVKWEKKIIAKLSQRSPALQLINVYALSDKGVYALKDLSLTLYPGEILGVAGVAGNGQKELVEILLGLRRVIKGKVYLYGKDITNKPPEYLIQGGLGVIPEDRMRDGIILGLPVAYNLILNRRHSFSKYGILLKKAIEEYARKLIKDYSIVTPGLYVPAYSLSGGNIQRLILARILAGKPSVIIAANPTAGLDIAATKFIWERLIKEAERGAAILLISYDLDEILALSDRIAVIYNGTIVGEVPKEKADKHTIGLMMGGVRQSNVN